jgi:biotin synthase
MTSQSLALLLSKENLSKDEIVTLLGLTSEDDRAALFKRADEVRARYLGDEVHLRGIIEIGNECDRHCLYCGLRRPNTGLIRYRMSCDEIIENAIAIAALPVHTIVLQSGEAQTHAPEELAYVIREIRKKTDAALTLSFGEWEADDYRSWFEAGADRYLLKHETMNRDLFRRLKPDSDLDNRIGCLRTLKDIGFQVGTGNMVGLPGQTLEDIADDIMFCRELEADMSTFGPFIASPFTPLSDEKNGSVELSLNTIAVARLVLHDTHIPANTAIATLDPRGRERALCCGANVVMPNFTPSAYRIHYQIYPHRKCITDEPLVCNGCIRGMITGLGRTVSDGRGDTRKQVQKDSHHLE